MRHEGYIAYPSLLGGVMRKYLRSKKDGFIYHWNPYLAQREDMEGIDELPQKEKPKVKTSTAKRVKADDTK